MPLRGLGRRLFNLFLDIVDYIGDTAIAIAGVMWRNVLSATKENIQLVEDIFGPIANKLAGNFVTTMRENLDFFEDIAGSIGRRFTKAISGGQNTVFDAISAYITAGNYDPQIKDALAKYFHQSNDIAQFIAFMGIPPAIFSTIFQAETSTYVLRKQQDDMAQELVGVLDVGAVMQMWAREKANKGMLASHLRRQGLSPEVDAAINEAIKQWLPLAQLAIAAQRGGVTAGAISEAARNQGFDQTQVDAALALAKNFLPLNEAAAATIRDPQFKSLCDSIAKAMGMEPRSVEASLVAAKVYLSPQQYYIAAQRLDITEGDAAEKSRDQGYDQTDLNTAQSLAKTFLNPVTLVNALWRGHIGSGEYAETMHKAGYSAQDANTFLQTAYFLPTPSDLITWQSKEVFEDDSILKYGLADEFENLNLSLFGKIGINTEQARNYWVSHWQHPSFTQVGEMFVRDILANPNDRNTMRPGSPEWETVRKQAEQEVYEWFRLVEVPPYWRKRMTEMLYNPYTRVDIRRMWDLDVVTDDEVLRAYLDQGYDIEHAKNLLAFTKVERRLPDITARYRNGWITQGEVLSELQTLGVSPETATRLYQRKFANLEQPLRIATERDLTKTEIISGIKKGIIDGAIAAEMLMGLGYDQAEADYLVLINTEFVGSPDTPLGFRRGVEAYNRAIGKPYTEIPDSIINLERDVMAATKALADAEFSGQPLTKIDELRTNLARLTSRFQIEKQRLKL